MKLGEISTSYIEIIAKVMAKYGCDVTEIFESYSLSPTTIASPDARVSIPKLLLLGHACIKLTNRPWLGLEMGRMTQATNLGMPGVIALSAGNLQQICDSIAHYEVLNSFNVRGQSTFSITSKGAERDGVLAFYSLNPYNEYNYFVVDSVLCGWVNVIENLTGATNAIKNVCFEFPAPSYADRYSEFFNCEVLFNQPANQLVIYANSLDEPCLTSCQPLYRQLKRAADTELANVQLGLSFTEKVARVITPLLNVSTPTLEQVAAQLNIAPWTIRRNLIGEGGNFQKVLNDTRRDLAISYVSSTNLSVGEIAYLLGFGSSTAFQHAFKRWTGQAPGSYKR